jgi:hypothetical protein
MMKLADRAETIGSGKTYVKMHQRSAGTVCMRKLVSQWSGHVVCVHDIQSTTVQKQSSKSPHIFAAYGVHGYYWSYRHGRLVYVQLPYICPETMAAGLICGESGKNRLDVGPIPSQVDDHVSIEKRGKDDLSSCR